MPKRKISEVEREYGGDSTQTGSNKNSLDSDEEDSEDEDDQYALQDEDIEGQACINLIKKKGKYPLTCLLLSLRHYSI